MIGCSFLSCNFSDEGKQSFGLLFLFLFMSRYVSLLDALPDIAKQGKKEVEKIMESLHSGSRIRLQTNEIVIPQKDTRAYSAFADGQRSALPENRMIYGDNLLVMMALLAGDEARGIPSLRGKVDLIYIDPPFDSKADYRTKIVLPSLEHEAGEEISMRPTTLEQTAYSDIWQE